MANRLFYPYVAAAVQKNMLLHVYYASPDIRVTPVAPSAAEERLAATYTRNEELLAKVFLSIAEQQDLPAHLVQYFRHRGWEVEELEPFGASS
jgi:hypothetical protein